MTRAEARQRVHDALNDRDGVLFPAADVDQALDEAAEVLAEASGAIKRTAFVPLTPGTMYYPMQALGDGIMMPYRLSIPSLDNRRLIPVSVAELDSRHQQWARVTGEPEHWFSVSWDLFGLWPGSASGGGVLRADCLAWPRALLDDDDEWELPQGDHDALVVYGAYDGWVRRRDGQRAVEAWSLFARGWRDATGRITRPSQARSYDRGGPGLVNGVSF